MKPETPNKSCSRENGLNKARATRHGVRRTNVGLKCSSCQRSFPSVVRLRRHLNYVHKNAGKVFCCSKCNITFDDLSVFLQHSRGHKLRCVEEEDEHTRKAVDTSENQNVVSERNGEIYGADLNESITEETFTGEILGTDRFENTEKGLLFKFSVRQVCGLA